MFDARKAAGAVLHPLVRPSLFFQSVVGFMDSSEARWQVGLATPGLQPRSFSFEAKHGCLRGPLQRCGRLGASLHDGQVVFNENAPHVRHCCIRCLAMMLTHVLRWPPAGGHHVVEDRLCGLLPHGFSHFEVRCLQLNSIGWSTIVEALDVNFFSLVGKGFSSLKGTRMTETPSRR